MRRQGMNSDGEVLSDFYVEHVPYEFFCADDGMTRQEFASECDINVLMAAYERTGVISHVNPRSPMYLDVSEVPDLASAIALMEAATSAFMSLPAKVRREFDNDPVRFVEFAQDAANIDQLREWGLAAPAPVPDAVPPGNGSETAASGEASPAAS